MQSMFFGRACFYQILHVQMLEACGKSAWNLRNDRKKAKLQASSLIECVGQLSQFV